MSPAARASRKPPRGPVVACSTPARTSPCSCLARYVGGTSKCAASWAADASNTPSQDEAEIVAFFGDITRNLLASEERAGVRHHVVLSIVGIDHGQRVPHYAGKRTQEQVIREGRVPYSIVRATQFHDF